VLLFMIVLLLFVPQLQIGGGRIIVFVGSGCVLSFVVFLFPILFARFSKIVAHFTNMMFFIFLLVGSRTVSGDFAVATNVKFCRRVGTTRSTDVALGTGLFQFEGCLVVAHQCDRFGGWGSVW